MYQYNSITRYLEIGGVLLLAFALSACAADIQRLNQNEDSSQETEDPNNSDPNNTTPRPDPGTLECVAPCNDGEPTAFSVEVDNKKTVKVKYLKADGTPNSDARVSFKFKNKSDEGIALTTASAATNDEGIAKTTVRAGSVPGDADIEATVSDDRVSPLTWSLSVTEKQMGQYQVNLVYDGQRDISPVSVRLFPSDQYSCDDYLADLQQRRLDPTAVTIPTAARQKSTNVVVGGQIPDIVFNEIPNGKSFTVLAHGSLRQNGEVQAAYGCADDNASVEKGNTVKVDVSLANHLPKVRGKYDVRHVFDIRGGLPTPVRLVVNLIGRLAVDPGSFIFGCPEQPAQDGACSHSPGAPGLLEMLANFLPPDSGFRQTVKDLLSLQAVNGTLRGITNTVAKDWLENKGPNWVDTTADVTDDIFQSLKRFEVEGSMNIDKLNYNPGESPAIIPEKGGSQQWDVFVVQWTGQCDESAPDFESCRDKKFGPGVLGNDTDIVEGKFSGKVFGTTRLQINQHSLNVSYGALSMAIIEQVVLPGIFGSDCGPNGQAKCDSVEDVLKALINCEDFANRVTTEQTTANTVDNMCNRFLDQTSDRLRQYVASKLMMEGGDKLTIETPPGRACKVHQPSEYPSDWTGYPLPYVQKLGQSQPKKKQCEWNVDLNLDNYNADVVGRFHGDRTSGGQQTAQ